MTGQEILDEIREVAAEFLDVGVTIDSETEILGDMQLDSLELVTLTVELENRFRICLEDGDVEGYRTVGDLIAHIGARVSDGGANGEPEHG